MVRGCTGWPITPTGCGASITRPTVRRWPAPATPQAAAGATAACEAAGDPAAAADEQVALSARTGAGLARLRASLLARAGWQALPEGVFIARSRHVQALAECDQHLAEAQGLAREPAAGLELLAEELRLAHRALESITGVFTTEDLLGQIFSRFCIGK